MSNLLRPIARRRLAVVALLFAALAQQVAFVAHGAMQVRGAIAGTMELCSSSGLAPGAAGSESPTAPAASLAACVTCAAGTVVAIDAPAPPAVATRPYPIVDSPAPRPAAHASAPKFVHHPRGPPVPVS